MSVFATYGMALCLFVLPFAVAPKAMAFEQVELSKNTSQLMRSNVGHFWGTAKDVTFLGDLAKYTQEQGIINGDPHLGNFSVIPVTSKKGKPELKFLNIDFDDGGHGPFALEFARYVAVAKASSGAIKVKDILTSYLDGLHGKKMEEPASVKAAEAITIEQYEIARAKYVAKRILNERFKYTPGEIEPWQGSPDILNIVALFHDVRVLDVARRPMERGGSLESLRLWVLIEDPSGVHRIVELKEYNETALVNYTLQPEMQERVNGLFEVFWRKTNPSSYKLVAILDKTYWMREKKVEVLEYVDKAAEDEGRLYIANLVGRFQGEQPEAASYIAKIDKDPEFFKEAVKNFVRKYIELAEAAIKSP
jgi:hypothetical protein